MRQQGGGKNTSWHWLHRIFIPLLGVLSLACVHEAAASSITDLGSLGGSWTVASAINASGTIAGNSTTPDDAEDHAFVYSAATGLVDLGITGFSSAALGINEAGQIVGNDNGMAFLYTPGVGITHLGFTQGFSQANAINDSGLVVGMAFDADLNNLPFAYSSATGVVNLGTLGGVYGEANAVNNSGAIVGDSYTSDSRDHAFLYVPGSGMVDLGTLGGNGSLAYGINDSGVVAGYSSLADNKTVHAFVYVPGQGMTDIGTLPGGTSSAAYGINASGQVVGLSDTNGVDSAMLYAGGVMTDLNTLLPANSGWDLITAYAINDSGQVAGLGALNDVYHAFLLDTTTASAPEPGSLVLCCAALCVWVFRSLFCRVAAGRQR